MPGLQESAVIPAGPVASIRKRRIALTTLGSLGDLHPYIALGRGLQARDHEVIIATSECHRKKIEALGLGYRVLRPDSAWVNDADVMRRFMHIRWGLVRVGREWILPALRESYEDILSAAESADLLNNSTQQGKCGHAASVFSWVL